MQNIGVIRQLGLLILLALVICLVSSGILGYSIFQIRDDASETAATIDRETTRVFSLIETGYGVQGNLQITLREKDPDIIEKLMAEAVA